MNPRNDVQAQRSKNASGGQRSPWQDPGLYVTATMAVLLVTLLDMAIRLQ